MSGWQPIETLPEGAEALVCVTHNVPANENDSRPSAGDGYVWETVMWTDWFDAEDGWFRWPRLIEIPFPPTHWMPLPDPPPSERGSGD
jgi:hypothetical protein